MIALLRILTLLFCVCICCARIVPKCVKGQANPLWPDYEESSRYFECNNDGSWDNVPCEPGLLFSFYQQHCVNAWDWVAPPIGVTDGGFAKIPLNAPVENAAPCGETTTICGTTENPETTTHCGSATDPSVPIPPTPPATEPTPEGPPTPPPTPAIPPTPAPTGKHGSAVKNIPSGQNPINPFVPPSAPVTPRPPITPIPTASGVPPTPSLTPGNKNVIAGVSDVADKLLPGTSGGVAIDQIPGSSTGGIAVLPVVDPINGVVPVNPIPGIPSDGIAVLPTDPISGGIAVAPVDPIAGVVTVVPGDKINGATPDDVSAPVDKIPGAPVLPPNKVPAVPSVPGAATDGNSPVTDNKVPGIPPSKVPATPVVPVPGSPKVPGTPDAAGTPKVPGSAGTPTVPKVPASPGTPGVPKVPGSPAFPAKPIVPGTPDAPGTPKNPATQDTSGAADSAAVPNTPGKPKVPAKPGTPGTPTNKKPAAASDSKVVTHTGKLPAKKGTSSQLPAKTAPKKTQKAKSRNTTKKVNTEKSKEPTVKEVKLR